MNRTVKSLLRLLASVMLYGGPVLGAVMAVLGATLAGSGMAPSLGASLTGGVVIALWGLVIGGGLKLLVSIDDRLERLENKA